ncbi:hypothetical protein GCM10018980_14990 [Streptomyces capoamus]|uniref:Uncharacterized protein n=1 Tax=Streptomyces capoamus TaxID=68183 RepID=A0A919C491_9ACTN|nr:hypothetical protein GCM10010501_19550 [Streptomyces libani subsp. rufus]GHG40610.1 hypothetical protein GCM10018980_14990 [Streptomyces capoamus]
MADDAYARLAGTSQRIDQAHGHAGLRDVLDTRAPGTFRPGSGRQQEHEGAAS